MVVSPCPAHAAGIDVVGHHVAIISKRIVTESALATLGGNLPVEQFPHFAVGAEFPVSPGMMWIFNAPNTHLALALFSWDCLPATAVEGAVDWAELFSTESHDALLIAWVQWFDWDWQKTELFASAAGNP
jgi:hypothetical protein